jgi:hypothetical protein
LYAGGREPDKLPREALIGLLAAIEPARGLLNNLPKDPKATEVIIALAGLYLATQAAAHLSNSEGVSETFKQGALFTQELPKRILEAAQAFQAHEPPEVPHDIDTILDTIRKPEGEELGNEYCNLPKNWAQLGEAYTQRVYGDGNKPRIVVDVSNHPDMQAPGCPFENVKYVIKHSDRSGQISVSVVPKSHDITEGSSWYEDLMRDEVQAEFMLHPETCKPFLVFRTHVGKGDHGLGSSAELMLDKMRKWSNHPAWQSLMTNFTKAWLNARLQVFDAHHFHPVESLLEVLDPAFRMNPQWENADIIWVNQSGDPDFNTVKAVGTVKPILTDLRAASEPEKQQKHEENREKAWREAIEGAQNNIKHILGDIGLKIGQVSRTPAGQQMEQLFAIMAVWLEQMMRP